jgi:carboxylesterase
MNKRLILDRAEPFFFPGGPVGCLLVHGFTGTPFEMRSLGQFLHAEGYTVLGVRLSGHATSLEDMIRMRYWDWLASVEDGYHMLSGHCEKIFVMGLSMGGVLSLTQAARLPFQGVVAMSTPYQFPVEWARRTPWLVRLVSPIFRTQAKRRGKWFNPELDGDHISYERNPTRPGYELIQLLKEMRAALPEITIPALVIHSRDDDYVLEHNAQPLFDHIGSPDKQLVWVDRASHVITRDGDTSRIFQPILAFLRSHS